MEKKTMKGWAVVVYDSFISHRIDRYGFGRAVFSTQADAVDFLNAQPEMKKMQQGKIVQCEVTFEV